MEDEFLEYPFQVSLIDRGEIVEAFAANGSHEAPRPSMLMAIWRSANSPVNFSEVNCDPWSLLKISGRPRCNARFRARMRNIRAPHLLTRSTVVPRNKYG